MTIAAIGACFTLTLPAEAAAPPPPAGWTQTFLDDFNGTALSDNWRHSEGTSYPGGPENFGTGEVEVNSRDNATVADGKLSITARGTGLGPWTSDRIETNRADFQPPPGGRLRVEARLQLPEAANGQSNGYWPAFWILGAPYRGNLWNWPTIGEIDIMENVSGINRTWQTAHCGWLSGGPNVCNETNGIGNDGAAGPCGTGEQACTKSFHTYTMDWSDADNSLTWYVDDRQVWRAQRGVNIRADAWDLAFEGHGFFIILNLAMGGQMPANNGVPLNTETTGGGHLDADYVAAYTAPGDGPTPTATPTEPATPTTTPTANPTANPTTTPTATPPDGSFPATRYLSGASLSATAGNASTLTVPSAGGGEHGAAPHDPLIFTATGLNATFTGGTTAFDLFTDAGTSIGNATEARLSYDRTGDGSFERVETYRYFATDPIDGWEHYTQSSGLVSATGTLGDLTNGQIKLEVWNAIGATSTRLGTGNQSKVVLPYR